MDYRHGLHWKCYQKRYVKCHCVTGMRLERACTSVGLQPHSPSVEVRAYCVPAKSKHPMKRCEYLSLKYLVFIHWIRWWRKWCMFSRLKREFCVLDRIRTSRPPEDMCCLRWNRLRLSQATMEEMHMSERLLLRRESEQDWSQFIR